LCAAALLCVLAVSSGGRHPRAARRDSGSWPRAAGAGGPVGKFHARKAGV